MKSIFKEVPQDEDLSPISPMSTMTALTPMSPFTLLYLRNLSNLSSFSPNPLGSLPQSGFSYLAEVETKKANEIKPSTTVCGCSKTKCLKLYCECFAEGKYCEDCNCKSCHNNEEHKDEREAVMIKTKVKNPGAFRVDISSNYKICHCNKSFCMKKYCECYQNGRSCNSNCKCKECKNLSKD